MESLVFQSPKKHRIIAIKKLLIENNIPVTSIKLHIYLTAYSRISEKEICDELNVPIEEFNEKLNDAQTFELYTDEKFEERAINIIENCDVETFFNDCIYKSNNYDEAFEIYQLLNNNNLQCDDIFTTIDIYTNIGKYLLFIDPENKDEAIKIIEQRNKVKNREYQNVKTNELFDQDYYENKKINYNNDNVFKEEKTRPAIPPVKKYYIVIGIILVGIVILLISAIVSAAQPKNLKTDNTLTQLFYYETFTITNENFIAVPKPILYVDSYSRKKSIKDYREQLRANGYNFYSSRENVTNNDIYEYLINFGLTPEESNKRIIALNTWKNVIFSRPYQDDSGEDYMEIMYIEKEKELWRNSD
jgi:hypothetical protein